MAQMMRLCFVLLTSLLAGCVQIYQYGASDSVTVMQSVMGTATIPVSAIPGLP